MKQKRSSGNVVHLLVRLIGYFCIKFRRNSAGRRKNGVAPDATAKQKCRSFENEKTPFAVAKK